MIQNPTDLKGHFEITDDVNNDVDVAEIVATPDLGVIDEAKNLPIELKIIPKSIGPISMKKLIK